MQKKNKNFEMFLLGVTVTSFIFLILFAGSIYIEKQEINRLNQLLQNQSLKLLSLESQMQKSDIIPSKTLSSTTKTIPVLAVSSQTGEGAYGTLSVRLIPGSGSVLIDTTPFNEPDLQYSANVAVQVAKEKTNNENLNNDLIFSFNISSGVVGGGSAGAAIAIATIAALENKEINPRVAMTGTINLDGTIGQVGGIVEKANAAANNGKKILLIPVGQSIITYYEQEVTQQTTRRGFTVYRTQYVPKTVDLVSYAKDNLGLEIHEVANIDEAMQYFFT